MEIDNTFTTENINDLKSTCQKIISICDENIDGALMMAQLMMLADRIEDFVKNPIVKYSGII